MRKLIDDIVYYILQLCFRWLFRHYDLFFDGVELWLREKFPDFSETDYDDFCPDMSEIPDPDLEE